MGDTLGVGEDQRGALVGLGFAKSVERLLRVGAHGDLRNINVAVGDRLEREVLARDALAGGGELRGGAERRRLRRLAAGVGIDLGVEHQNVDVAPGGQHVVEAAVADVIGPAVAADDPDAAPDEVVDHRQKIAGGLAVQLEEARLQLGDADALGPDLRFLDLRRLEDGVGQILTDDRSQLAEQRLREFEMLVGGEAETKAELGVVLEEGIRPRRAAALAILRPGGDRLAAAVDRRATCGVGDLGAIAEELREELQVRGFSTTGAGSGEFEQRLEKLDAAHVGEVDAGAVVDREFLEEGEVRPLGGDQRFLVRHVDCLDARLARADRRAGLDAEAAAGAILDVELQRETGLRVAACVDRGRLEGGGRAGEEVLVVVARADNAVRADEAALAALDAEVFLPHRHAVGDVALLVGAGAGGEGAVRRDEADRNVVAAPGEHLGGHLLYEIGG